MVTTQELTFYTFVKWKPLNYMSGTRDIRIFTNIEKSQMFRGIDRESYTFKTDPHKNFSTSGSIGFRLKKIIIMISSYLHRRRKVSRQRTWTQRYKNDER